MQELSQWTHQTAVSEYTKDAALAFGLVSYGFAVLLAYQEGEEWTLVLVDELNRDKPAAKSALQEASVAYALLNDSAHIEATVHSNGVTHRIGVSGEAESPLTWLWGGGNEGTAGGGGYLKRPVSLVVDEPSSSSAASVGRLPGWSCWAGAPARL